jgi:hypothetical protein
MKVLNNRRDKFEVAIGCKLNSLLMQEIAKIIYLILCRTSQNIEEIEIRFTYFLKYYGLSLLPSSSKELN